MLCGCDCGHILWCLILRSIHKSGGPADESQSDLLKGNSALQLDGVRRWHMSHPTSRERLIQIAQHLQAKHTAAGHVEHRQ
jgi:hypothetical protein